MKSNFNIKGHPVHPMLVGFPMTLFFAGFVFDLLAWNNGTAELSRTALYLQAGGVFMALLAAIPGIVDYFFSVPPESSARTRARNHGLINSSVVLIICLVIFLKFSENASLPVVLSLELVALALLGIAGWMGGTLVVRNQIGVDHRYAGAGKWKEEYIHTRDNEVEIKIPESLKVDQMRLVHVNNRRIVIARTKSGLVAFEDFCSHRGASLADGVMICETVQCPWHGSQFDVRTGQVKAGPADKGISCFDLKIKNNAVYLVINNSSARNAPGG